ncbi:MAG: hypothetical protein QOE70_868 [Chthoniobacter sp.]|nr:hypothetical protein [Chthoniobacter sp.]
MSKLAILAVIVLAAAAAEGMFELPVARLTLRSVDEDGKPIAGATVNMSFEEPTPRFWGGTVVHVDGVTDAKGEFTGEGHSFDTKGGQILKEGYYVSGAKSYKFEKAVLGKWQPWNPTVDVVLKKVINPIPMYARKVGFDVKGVEVPGLGEPYGFDLIESDWLAPHGKGKVSDLRFAAERRFVSRRDYDGKIAITFSNPGDGLQVIETTSPKKALYFSDLKLPREAPEGGYAPALVTRVGGIAGGSSYEDARDDRSYFFRVRTELDNNGKVLSALYGKIDGDIRIDAINSNTCSLQFTYYLNPTPNDRNLEFDPKRNLFPKLPDSEQVKNP